MTHDHDHDHDPDHEHGHDHGHDDGHAVRRPEAAPRGGPVVLDIGGDIGALIVRLDDRFEGTELGITSLDDPGFDKNAHTGVWRRPVNGSTVVVAVYPELPSGRYQVSPDGASTVTVVIEGGAVCETDCRTSVRSGT